MDRSVPPTNTLFQQLLLVSMRQFGVAEDCSSDCASLRLSTHTVIYVPRLSCVYAPCLIRVLVLGSYAPPLSTGETSPYSSAIGVTLYLIGVCW